VIEGRNTEVFTSCGMLTPVALRVAGSRADGPDPDLSNTEPHRIPAPRIPGRAARFTPTRR